MSSFLFIGAGRRVSMIERFKDRGHKVFLYELDEDCVGSFVANAVIRGKRWEDYGIGDDIIENCKTYKIDCIIPFMDMGCLSVSKIKERLLQADILSIVSSFQICSIFTDKKQTCLSLHDNGILIPSVWSNKRRVFDSCFPIISKPINGFGSRGIKIFNNKEQLLIDDSTNCIYQKFVYGKEYSIDCIVAKNTSSISIRSRDKIRAGEVEISTIVENEEIRKICNKIIKLFKFYGPITIQGILGFDNQFYITEINPRFGGGCILSMEAGMNYIEWIESQIEKTSIKLVEPIVGMRMFRADREYFVK